MASHRSRFVIAWLEQQDGHIAVAPSPYAPGRNPVEAIWPHLEKHELANLRLDTIGAVTQFARNCLKPMQRRPQRD